MGSTFPHPQACYRAVSQAWHVFFDKNTQLMTALNAGGSEEKQETPRLGSKRKFPASNAAQPAKRKHQALAPLKPAKASKAASATKPTGQRSARTAAVQLDKVQKWAKQLEQSAAPKAAAPKHGPADPNWDSLTADDILGQLWGAAEEFEAKKGSFSLALE